MFPDSSRDLDSCLDKLTEKLNRDALKKTKRKFGRNYNPSTKRLAYPSVVFNEKAVSNKLIVEIKKGYYSNLTGKKQMTEKYNEQTQ